MLLEKNVLNIRGTFNLYFNNSLIDSVDCFIYNLGVNM